MKANALFRRIFRIVFSTALSCAVTAGTAYATPSTQIWIPSTDIQPYKTVHLNFDTYVRTKPEGADPNRQTGVPSNQNLPPVYVIGPTFGVLPFAKIQAEVGFDLIYGGSNTGFGLDKYPAYGHVKIGMPEDNTWIPAVAVGMYNIGTKSGDARKGELATNQGHRVRAGGEDLPDRGPSLRRLLLRQQEGCWSPTSRTRPATSRPTRRGSCSPGTGR